MRYFIKVVVDGADKARIEEEARRARLPVATWARQVLVREIERTGSEK